MKIITKLSVLAMCVMLGISCTKETPQPSSTYQGGAAGYSLPAEMKGAEVTFYRNLPENEATCEGLFAIITSDNEDYVIEITNAVADPLIKDIVVENKTYLVDFEFLQLNYMCYEKLGKSGTPGSEPVIQVQVEKVILSKVDAK